MSTTVLLEVVQGIIQSGVLEFTGCPVSTQ